MTTKEDKIYLGVGAAALVGGGFWWWNKSKKDDTNENSNGNDYLDSGTGSVDTIKVLPQRSNLQTTTTSTATGDGVRVLPAKADSFSYAVGQTVMAIKNNVVPYKAIKRADGSFVRDDKNTGSKYDNGETIGKIVSKVVLNTGEWRYVVDSGIFGSFLWVKHVDIKNVDALIVPKKVLPISKSLDLSKLLRKGSKGKEVSQLQSKIGFKGTEIDGDFGNKTEGALLEKAGVKQISLNGFAKLGLGAAFTVPFLRLNFDKILRFGSQGSEVSELQKKLGFVTREFAMRARFSSPPNIINGIFDRKTLKMLVNAKGVNQISLRNF